MKLHRVYLVIAAPDGKPVTVDEIIANDLTEEIVFAAVVPGYVDEFADLGADASGWPIDREPTIAPTSGYAVDTNAETETDGNSMNFDDPTKESKVRDTLRWVAQEARGIKMSGVTLPKGSRLREALQALEDAYEGGTSSPPAGRPPGRLMSSHEPLNFRAKCAACGRMGLHYSPCPCGRSGRLIPDPVKDCECGLCKEAQKRIEAARAKGSKS